MTGFWCDGAFRELSEYPHPLLPAHCHEEANEHDSEAEEQVVVTVVETDRVVTAGHVRGDNNDEAEKHEAHHEGAPTTGVSP